MSLEREGTPPRVVLVIPAYNEESTIRRVAQRALATGYPLIVVDDGSTDGTRGELGGLPLELVRHESNQGKARALWTGLQAALARGADLVATLDADGQHRPEDLPALVERARRHPRHLVIGARLLARDAAPGGRRFANRVGDFFVSWAAGQALADSQSGYRLYPRELLEELGPRYEVPRGFVFESEVLIVAAGLGYRCAFVPIEAIYPPARRPSHFRPARDTFAIGRMLAVRILRRGVHPRGFWNAFIAPRRRRLAGVGPLGFAFLVLSCLWILATLGISLLWVGFKVWRIGQTASHDAPPGALPLVLGVRTLGGATHAEFLARLRHGFELWSRDGSGEIVVLGGLTSDHPRTEAEEGRDLLESWGVPPGNIVTEGDSIHTLQNLEHAREHLDPGEMAAAVIVTNRFHALRCLEMARQLGLKVPVSVCEARPSRGWLPRLRVLKEAFLLHWFYVGRLLSRRG